MPTLHLRMLNERTTPILDVNLQVGMLIEDHDGDRPFRRLIDLKLVRQRLPIFGMAFTIMHTLDADSPLHAIRLDPERMVILIVTMRGVDDRTLQPMFARALFQHEQLAFGQGFGDMVDIGPDGVIQVDARQLDEVTPRPLGE